MVDLVLKPQALTDEEFEREYFLGFGFQFAGERVDRNPKVLSLGRQEHARQPALTHTYPISQLTAQLSYEAKLVSRLALRFLGGSPCKCWRGKTASCTTSRSLRQPRGNGTHGIAATTGSGSSSPKSARRRW